MAAEIRDQAKAVDIDMLKENSDINFRKIHCVEYLVEHIGYYCYLGQYLSKISKRANKQHIKEGWRRSNDVDIMARILKQGDNCHSMMKMKT